MKGREPTMMLTTALSIISVRQDPWNLLLVVKELMVRLKNKVLASLVDL
jgi:hypothetical protein